MKQIHIISRLANWSLLTVLLALTGFSIWAAMLNEQATNVAASSSYVSGLYRQITFTLSSEEALQYEYVLRPSTLVRNEHQAAANTLIALLQRLQHDEEPDDANLSRQALADQSRYLIAASQFFAAVDAHDLTRGRTIHYREIDPVFDQIQKQLQKKANEEQVLAIHNLGQLVQVQRTTFTKPARESPCLSSRG